MQRRRVESLVLGALSSSPVHRALVLVLGTNIAVLLDCSSRLDSVAFLTYRWLRHRLKNYNEQNFIIIAILIMIAAHLSFLLLLSFLFLFLL